MSVCLNKWPNILVMLDLMVSITNGIGQSKNKEDSRYFFANELNKFKMFVYGDIIMLEILTYCFGVFTLFYKKWVNTYRRYVNNFLYWSTEEIGLHNKTDEISVHLLACESYYVSK